MTDYIVACLIEEYYNEEKHKNDKLWYDNYIYTICKNFATSQDEDEIDELVDKHREEALQYLKHRYEYDCIYNHGLSNEDLYTALLIKWIIKYHKDDLENPIKNI